MDQQVPAQPSPGGIEAKKSLPSVWLDEASLLLGFVRRPTLSLPDRSTRPIYSWLAIFSLSAAVTAFVAVPVIVAATAIYDPPSIPDEGGLLEAILLAAVAAPLLEEPAWRLWISSRRRHVFIAGVFLALWVLLALADEVNALTIIGGGATALTIVLLGGAMAAASGTGSAFRSAHVPWLVWFGALAFGLLHLSNFEADSYDFRYWWLLPVIVTPQILSGLVYSYARIRLGFWAAVGVHGMENLVLTLLAELE